MFLPSTVLFGSVLLLVKLSCVTGAFDYSIHLWNSPIIFTLPLLLTTQSESGRLIKYKWCSWSEWSRCSPEPCIAGIQHPNSEIANVDTNEEDWIVKTKRDTSSREELVWTNGDAANYCVVKPGPLSNRNRHPLLVQTTVDGVIKRREPARQRVRRCTCRSLSIWNLISIQKINKCLPDSVQVECGQCNPNGKVYETRQYEFDESVLPFCDPSSTGSFQLYKILGGVAGAIIVIISIVWFVRVLVRTLCRSSNSVSSTGARGSARRFDREHGSQESRRTREGRSSRSRSNANNSTDPLHMTSPMFRESELPPSYKDVVSGIPDVLFVGREAYMDVDHPTVNSTAELRSGRRLNKTRGGRFRGHENRREPNGNSTSLEDDMQGQTASSSQTITQKRSNTPPPPSYEDVMSLSVLQPSMVGVVAPVALSPDSVSAPVDGDVGRTMTPSTIQQPEHSSELNDNPNIPVDNDTRHLVNSETSEVEEMTIMDSINPNSTIPVTMSSQSTTNAESPSATQSHQHCLSHSITQSMMNQSDLPSG